MSVDEKSEPLGVQRDEPKSKTSSSSDKKSSKSQRVLLVPYPKFVFMYPTLIVAAVSSILMWFGGYHQVNPATDTMPVVMTALFLAVMMANMFVIVFDFPRATSLTLVFVLTSIALGSWMLVIAKPDVLPSVGRFVTTVRPAANTSFFGCITIGMMLMFVES